MNNQRGYSIIEWMIGLGLLVGLLSIIMGIAKQNYSSKHSTQLMEDLQIMILNTRTAFNHSPNGFSALSNNGNQVAITMNLVPNDLQFTQGSDIIKNQFGGNIIFGSDDSNSFFIQYDKIPSEVCQKILPTIGLSDYIAVTVNNVAAWQSGETASLPDVTQIASLCTNNGKNTTNISIKFVTN